jgi:hypothetical protein
MIDHGFGFVRNRLAVEAFLVCPFAHVVAHRKVFSDLSGAPFRR